MLTTALEQNHISYTAQQAEQLQAYLQRLNHWNQAYNLTAIKDPKEQIYKHIIDSLTILNDIQGRVLDAGTGAGLPGIPLAIMNPDQTFYLVDSLAKRIRFIQHVIASLKLSQVKAEHQRLETWQGQTFDTIVSRAFSSLNGFIQTTKHLLAPNGQFLAMKGAYPTEELADIPKDFEVASVRELSIVGLEASRHVVIIKRKR